MRYTITKYPIAIAIPIPHQIRPSDNEAEPAAALAMVMLLAGSLDDGSSTGYKAKAAPQSIATMYRHDERKALRSRPVRLK